MLQLKKCYFFSAAAEPQDFAARAPAAAMAAAAAADAATAVAAAVYVHMYSCTCVISIMLMVLASWSRYYHLWPKRLEKKHDGT